MKYRIGALTISQSPRPDLLTPLVEQFPEHTIIEAGALDHVDTSTLPDGTHAPYPLTTTLNNGDHVTLDRDFLAPLVQNALLRLDAQDIDICMLLCAGDFPNLVGNMPVIQPTQFAQHSLRAMGITHLAVISPIMIQVPPIEKKWTDAGFQPIVRTMPQTTLEQQASWINSQCEAHPEVTCVVLDYVGYSTASTLTLQQLVRKPIFNLGHFAILALSAYL